MLRKKGNLQEKLKRIKKISPIKKTGDLEYYNQSSRKKSPHKHLFTNDSDIDIRDAQDRPLATEPAPRVKTSRPIGRNIGMNLYLPFIGTTPTLLKSMNEVEEKGKKSGKTVTP